MVAKKIYRSKRHTDDVAQRVGSFIEEHSIRTVDELIDAARPKGSPIHDDFDWDPDKAMINHLRRQANRFMRFIRVDNSESGTREVHAFYAIKSREEEREEVNRLHIYYTHDEVKSDEEKKERLGEVYYGKLLAYCKNAEDIGLDRSNETWNRLIRYIRKNAP